MYMHVVVSTSIPSLQKPVVEQNAARFARSEMLCRKIQLHIGKTALARTVVVATRVHAAIVALNSTALMQLHYDYFAADSVSTALRHRQGFRSRHVISGTGWARDSPVLRQLYVIGLSFLTYSKRACEGNTSRRIHVALVETSIRLIAFSSVKPKFIFISHPKVETPQFFT